MPSHWAHPSVHPSACRPTKDNVTERRGGPTERWAQDALPRQVAWTRTERKPHLEGPAQADATSAWQPEGSPRPGAWPCPQVSLTHPRPLPSPGCACLRARCTATRRTAEGRSGHGRRTGPHAENVLRGLPREQRPPRPGRPAALHAAAGARAPRFSGPLLSVCRASEVTRSTSGHLSSWTLRPWATQKEPGPLHGSVADTGSPAPLTRGPVLARATQPRTHTHTPTQEARLISGRCGR